MNIPAEQLNAQIRAKVVEMLAALGRESVSEAAKSEPLLDVVDMIFNELSDADYAVQRLPKLESRIAELESLLADTRGPMERQIANLNTKLIEMNRAALSAEVRSALQRAAIKRLLQVFGAFREGMEWYCKNYPDAARAMDEAIEFASKERP